MPRLIALLSSLVLAVMVMGSGACTPKTGGTEPLIPPEILYTQGVITSLSSGALAANLAAAEAAENDRPGRCAALGITAGLLSAGETITRLVALGGDHPTVPYAVEVQRCGIERPESLGDMASAQVIVSEIVAHVQAELADALLRPYLLEYACRPLAVADGTVSGVAALVEGIMAAVADWDLSLSGEFGIDYSACAVAAD